MNKELKDSISKGEVVVLVVSELEESIRAAISSLYKRTNDRHDCYGEYESLNDEDLKEITIEIMEWLEN